MQTLSEIHKAEADVRARSFQFEKLSNTRTSLRARIEQLESKGIDVTPLERILELSGDVPREIVTSGRSNFAHGIPGGMIVRDALVMLASGALETVRRKEAERVEQLTVAREQLARVEEGLKEFEG